MREFAIGDIHGCVRSLRRLLEIIQPERTDTVIFLGDYINRGPGSCEVIETIIDLNRKCTVIALAGNHEKMTLRARSEPSTLPDWLSYGGEATLDSYARNGYARNISAIPERHWHFFLHETLEYWETNERIFVHATIDPELDMNEQPEFMLFWQPFSDPTVHKSGKQLICGHTSQKSGLPAIFNKGVCIDTWACGKGWLTCYDTIEQRFIQANEKGENRSFSFQELMNGGQGK